jgi:hypothetical protein
MEFVQQSAQCAGVVKDAADDEYGYEVAGYLLVMVTRRADEFRMERLKNAYDYRSGAQVQVLVPAGTLTYSRDINGHAFIYTLKEDVVLKENMSVALSWEDENSIYRFIRRRRWKRIRT